MHTHQDLLRIRSEPSRSGSSADARVGDLVYAEDGAIGTIDHVIESEGRVPIFLVVAVRRFLRRRYPVIPWSFVTTVDRARRSVYVEGERESLARLSETLPIAL